MSGNFIYTGNYSANTHLAVQGNSSPVASVSLPAIDYAYLHNQATTYGQVVSSSSSGQTFSFNSLYGNKVIWIKGNLTNPTVTIGGLWASGGTFVVDGTVTLSSATTTLGSAGYPVYIVAQGDITHSGNTLNLVGGLYTTGNLNHKTCNVTGQFVANKAITNSATGQCTFSGAALPWFDNRTVPAAPALPMYTAKHVGVGP